MHVHCVGEGEFGLLCCKGDHVDQNAIYNCALELSITKHLVSKAKLI